MPTETVAYSMQGCFRPMTEEEKIAVDKMESERAEEAFRKATKQTLSQRIKKWWKTENIIKRKQVTNLFFILQILG